MLTRQNNKLCFVDIEAQKLIAEAKAPPLMDLKYFEGLVKSSSEALEKCLMKAVEFDRHQRNGAEA